MRFGSPTLATLPALALSIISIAGCRGVAGLVPAQSNGNASAPAGSNAVAPSAVGTSSSATPPAGSSNAIPVPQPPAASPAPPAATSSSDPAPPPPPAPAPAPNPDPNPPPTPPPPSPTPTPPPTPAGKTISNIEQMPGWESCDTCTGGGPIAFSMAQGVGFPQPGSTQFSIGQGTAWAGALWWKRLGTDTTPSHFVLTLDQYMDNPAASFGVEYDANQIIDGNWYDFAVQCSFGYGIWQVWDDANQHWVPTSAPCPRPAPSSHVQLRLEFERLNGQAMFVSIGTNGNIVPLNMAFNPQPSSGLNGDFGVHIQLNTNGNPDPYSVWVHDMALNYW